MIQVHLDQMLAQWATYRAKTKLGEVNFIGNERPEGETNIMRLGDAVDAAPYGPRPPSERPSAPAGVLALEVQDDGHGGIPHIVSARIKALNAGLRERLRTRPIRELGIPIAVQAAVSYRRGKQFQGNYTFDQERASVWLSMTEAGSVAYRVLHNPTGTAKYLHDKAVPIEEPFPENSTLRDARTHWEREAGAGARRVMHDELGRLSLMTGGEPDDDGEGREVALKG